MTSGTNENDKKTFVDWMEINYPSVSDKVREKLLMFGELVGEAGDRMGLVSRGDVARVYMRHVRESLAPALVERLPQGTRVADMGSGGGFPGIPLGLIREDLDMALVEPRHRKGAFLERTVLHLGIKNTRVYTASLDALVRDDPELRFDIVVSRGLGWTAPMVERLEGLVEGEGPLLRFGSPDFSHTGVEVVPIDPETPRAIHVWPRPTWRDLPKAP